MFWPWSMNNSEVRARYIVIPADCGTPTCFGKKLVRFCMQVLSGAPDSYDHCHAVSFILTGESRHLVPSPAPPVSSKHLTPLRFFLFCRPSTPLPFPAHYCDSHFHSFLPFRR